MKFLLPLTFQLPDQAVLAYTRVWKYIEIITRRHEDMNVIFDCVQIIFYKRARRVRKIFVT